MSINKPQNSINWQVFGKNIWLIFIQPNVEVCRGLKSRSLAYGPCLLLGTVCSWLVIFHIDRWAWNLFFLSWLYPERWLSRLVYDFFVLTFPLWVWGAYQTGLVIQFTKKLGERFILAGLKNNLGKVPRLISDIPLDDYSRKLKVTNACFPLDAFNKARQSLESGLRIYIDEIRESRAGGTIDITYSHEPMPSLLKLENVLEYKDFSFLIGTTRSKLIKGSLRNIPHLLIGGESGGGKSTFVRQLITTFYLNNPNSNYVLIDLKGGLEFQLFDGLPRVAVTDGIETTISALEDVELNLEDRLKFLRGNNLKDLEALEKCIKAEKITLDVSQIQNYLSRKIVVIDEAAEMFLGGHQGKASEIQKAKYILSRIARQGRAIGINLVVATQRPDVQSLDSQVKANLSGILSTRMSNNASSMTVLGNGRAADLPAIPGRAIWKHGFDLIEVQTPFLSEDAAAALLLDKRKPTPPKKQTETNENVSSAVGKSPVPEGPKL